MREYWSICKLSRSVDQQAKNDWFFLGFHHQMEEKIKLQSLHYSVNSIWSLREKKKMESEFEWISWRKSQKERQIGQIVLSRESIISFRLCQRWWWRKEIRRNWQLFSSLDFRSQWFPFARRLLTNSNDSIKCLSINLSINVLPLTVNQNSRPNVFLKKDNR